jgi:DNA-binding GntR family transcriptional regulator
VVALPGRSTTVSVIDARVIGDARDVVAAMHELAVRQVAGRLSVEELERMRGANRRFAEALNADVTAAMEADDELHGIPVRALGNRALESVLEQFGPVVRRVERLRFGTDGHASVGLHDRLIDLIEAGDAEGAASVSFEIWHSLPVDIES